MDRRTPPARSARAEKIGSRSAGPAGCSVPGFSGGSGSPGRSTSRFTHCVGISRSDSRNFTGWSAMGTPLGSVQRHTSAAHRRGAVLGRRPREGESVVIPMRGTASAPCCLRVRRGPRRRGGDLRRCRPGHHRRSAHDRADLDRPRGRAAARLPRDRLGRRTRSSARRGSPAQTCAARGAATLKRALAPPAGMSPLARAGAHAAQRQRPHAAAGTPSR